LKEADDVIQNEERSLREKETSRLRKPLPPTPFELRDDQLLDEEDEATMASSAATAVDVTVTVPAAAVVQDDLPPAMDAEGRSLILKSKISHHASDDEDDSVA
jgi:hypothetical protein